MGLQKQPVPTRAAFEVDGGAGQVLLTSVNLLPACWKRPRA